MALGVGNWSVVTLRYNGTAELMVGEDKSGLACADDNDKTCNTQLVAFGHIPPLAKGNGRAFAGWFTNESIVELVNTRTLGKSSTVYAGFGYWLTVWNFETEETWTRLMQQVNEVFSIGIDLDDLGYDDCLIVKWSGVNADKVVRAGTPREDAYVMPACDAEMRTYLGNITYTVTLKYSSKCGKDSGKMIGIMVLDCGTIFGTTMPPMGDRNGQKFSTWTLDEECTLSIPTLTTVKQDVSAYACWENGVYVLRFIFNNGTEDKVEELYYDETIEYPRDPVKKGYTFIGWDINIDTMPAHDLNITAKWEEKREEETTNQVEIVFGSKDLTKKEFEKLFKQYTDAKFTITIYENESGEVRVIIKFIDKEDAENFVEKIRASSEMSNIKKVNFTTIFSDDDNSAPLMLYPFSFLNMLLLKTALLIA